MKTKKQKVQVIITLFGSVPDSVEVFAKESDALEFYVKKAKEFGVKFNGEVTQSDIIDAVVEQMQDSTKNEIHWFESEVK